MLYTKNKSEILNEELFRNPTSEYRATPFWAWNCKLNKEELEWQLEVFKKMGFGGAHMHVRIGLDTPYLSEEFMDVVKACVEKAKKENMLAWLYDEDRYPSGAAGGIVTQEVEYREKYLLFTAIENPSDEEYLLACYDVELDEDGYLQNYAIIDKCATAEHEKWYAYLKTSKENPWFNNQTYINTIDKKAVDKFIEVTHETYYRTLSSEFGKTIPAMFADEPHIRPLTVLKNATDKAGVELAWSEDFVEMYAKRYAGEDILSGVPELVWERCGGQPSVIRYHYHDYVCERFATAFADTCGAWCREHGIDFTGHLMDEPTMKGQTVMMGEAMRCYRGFSIPGMDVLCNRLEFTTAKQVQSSVHQYGREAMLSELYGVTGWDFDFRGHKFQGDWQAVLGVTVRVPHISWASMAGEAKRDYPASIHYQSPWWDKYSLVEDHFARLNTALTRGKPIVRIGVIHPIESFWLHFGPENHTRMHRETMDAHFKELTNWLLFGGLDFDFISESLLPELCTSVDKTLTVGEMNYDIILVPECETLRSSTFDILERFAQAGGRVVVIGETPKYEDARPSTRGASFQEKAEQIPYRKDVLLQKLASFKEVEIRKESGTLLENLLYQMRQDGEGRWLFLCHGTLPYNKHISKYEDTVIRIKGMWNVTLFNTLNGEKEKITYCAKDGYTTVRRRLYDYDSLLLWLEPCVEMCEQDADVMVPAGEAIKIASSVPYSLSEPNALLLDMAEYSLDGEPWQDAEEILRIDETCRLRLGWPSRRKKIAQPWTVSKEPIEHEVTLRWHVQSAIAYKGALLAIEDAKLLKLKWNGKTIKNDVQGWYVDKAIQTVALPDIKKGENILEATIPFGKRSNLEWVYILGDFGVEVCGKHTRIIEARKELAFGDITVQGLPFYGGNITYHIPVETTGGEVRVTSGYYEGTLQEVCVDDGVPVPIIYPPYDVSLGKQDAGKHTIHLTMYGHRRNGFGPVHLTDITRERIGPEGWRSEKEWCYEYILFKEGVLATPEIREKKEKQEETKNG